MLSTKLNHYLLAGSVDRCPSVVGMGMMAVVLWEGRRMMIRLLCPTAEGAVKARNLPLLFRAVFRSLRVTDSTGRGGYWRPSVAEIGEVCISCGGSGS